MSRYGSVTITGPTSLITRIVESADPADLAARVTAALAALPAGYVVVAMTLAGAGDGHVFTVTIEAGVAANVTGGLSSPLVTCYLASSADALLAARQQAAPASGVYTDTQVAGASTGTRFMGMIVRGTLSEPTSSALVQSGYDETVVETSLVQGGGLYPRDAEEPPNPLVVVLPGVIPGNVLEISWNASVQNVESNEALAQVTVRAIVSWDGSVVVPGTFQFVVNAADVKIIPRTADPGAGIALLAARSAVTIPAGATTATVFLLYAQTANSLLTGGSLEAPGLNVSLRVQELLASSVAQVGPATLVPIVP